MTLNGNWPAWDERWVGGWVGGAQGRLLYGMHSVHGGTDQWSRLRRCGQCHQGPQGGGQSTAC